MPAAATRRSPMPSPIQPAICAAARGQRPRTRKASSTWAKRVPGRVSRARQATAAATATPSRSRAIGQRGSWPLAEPSASTSASQSSADGAERRRDPARRPEPALVREHAREESEADGAAEPGRRDRVDERAGAVARGRVGARRLPPQRVSAEAQPDAEAKSEAPKAQAASQSQLASAAPSPSMPSATRSPSSCGVAASATSAAIEPTKRASVAFPQFEFEVHLVSNVRRRHRFLRVLSA